MSLQGSGFAGFANPVDPSPAELRAWAHDPGSVPLDQLPPDWDLLVAGDHLVATLFDLAMDPTCPARRFALHCLYIYAADSIRTKFRAHSKRKLMKMLDRAESDGDEQLLFWAHNSRALQARPELFDYHDWCEGGLVRRHRRIG
ncbi:hypothetical protein [Melissospora conviva]|uniref:hypothetical protein n=1 Tax=Melissospora conviva TaxID=3388432 RepID=UPI003B7E3B4E